jgi:hypothetical protein
LAHGIANFLNDLAVQPAGSLSYGTNTQRPGLLRHRLVLDPPPMRDGLIRFAAD